MTILYEEDRKLIISLLNEYSEKLLNICEQIDMIIRQQRNLGFLFWLLLAFGWGMVFSLLSFISFTKPITIITIITITIFSQFFISSIYFGIQKQRLELLQKASIISAKLEKVIRAASQAQEHMSMARGLFNDLELDLRLSDAELALQHYTNLVKKRKLFGYF